MNGHESVCESVHNTNKPTNNSNTDPLKPFRTKENSGEEYQGEGEFEVAMGSNKPTNRQIQLTL